MASRFITPVFQAIDGKGKALPGAKLDFFEPGSSTTRKNTFSDEALLTKNANPVLADGAGIFPNIYGDSEYRVVLKDSKNRQQWERKNVRLDVLNDSDFDINGGVILTKNGTDAVFNFNTLNAAVISTNLADGQALNVKERTEGNGGGALWDVVLSSTVTENTFDIVQATGVSTLSLVLRTDGIKNAKQMGAVGDYVATTDTGTDDTLAMQNLFNNLTDGDEIQIEGNILLDRDTANIVTVQGVASYICVANTKKNIKITGTGTIFQRFNVLDTVGVCFLSCDDLYLDMPIIDGNFRYTAAQPITFKQQLLHIIGGKRHRGGFTVRNSSNFGFLLTNQFGEEAGYVDSEINTNIYSTIIAENCLQNTTFGTAVQDVIIESFICKNPILAALKFSSEISGAAPSSTVFRNLNINNFSCSYDSTWVNPNNEGDTGPNASHAVLDSVSTAQNCGYGDVRIDCNNLTIASIAIKQHTSTNGGKTGNLSVQSVRVFNQNVIDSTVFDIDNEAAGISVGRIYAENVSKVINVSNATAGDVQPRAEKYIDIDEIIVTGSNRAIVTVSDYTADRIRIGRLLQKTLTTNQAVFISGSCDIDHITLPDVDVLNQISINGVVNKTIKLKGIVDTSGISGTPVFIDLTTDTTILDYSVMATGDDAAGRRLFFDGLAEMHVGTHSIKGCPDGATVSNVTTFRIADTSPVYEDVTLTQPWQFNTGSVGTVQGTFEFTGSPDNTLLASSGTLYKRTDEGAGLAQLHIKALSTESASRLLGWRLVTVS